MSNIQHPITNEQVNSQSLMIALFSHLDIGYWLLDIEY